MGMDSHALFLPTVAILKKDDDVTIRTLLLCWLCGRATDLTVTLFPGATLGAPRFWCSRCTSPRNFARRLRERIAALEAQGEPLLDANAQLWNSLSYLLAAE